MSEAAHGRHGHGHDHAAGANRVRLGIAIAITAVVLVIEIVGATISGSLALLADAGHMLSDLTGLLVALAANVVGSRHASDARTFGHRRVEVFAAFINAAILLGVVVFILVEAFERFLTLTTQSIQSTPMLVVAIIGAIANVVALLVLRGGVGASINMRGAYLEVLGDLVGSVAVIVAAVAIASTGFLLADPIASVFIAVLIVPRAILLLREVVLILSQGTPKGTDVAMIREHVLAKPGVVGVHDVHVWSVTPGQNVFSAHVVVEASVFSRGETANLLDALNDCLSEHFDVEHSTFQLEPVERARSEPVQHP
ncbi:MAG: cation transporter [Homoserinimonas sp.]|jgi:cobalt-zinc-cadmium efflux system protein|nr:cation transporter [Homoserinimonas sp.]